MKRAVILCVLAVLVAGGAWAQGPANDVGAPAHNGPSLPLGVTPDGVVTCPPAGPLTTAFTGATTQLGRIFRDGVPSVCPSKVYPGIFNAATTFNYETFTYTNTSGATACVTVNFDPNTGGAPCGTNAHASAYLSSYNPASQATNYVGDVGSSVTQPFSFDVPAGTDMVLVVTNTASQAICDFTFQVVNLPCVVAIDADLELTKTATPPSVPVGDPVVFTLTVTNNGPGPANNTVVTDTLPACLTYVSNDCGAGFAAPTLTWNVGTLANAASATCNVTATVNSAGACVNNATAVADETDPNTANNSGVGFTVLGTVSVLDVPSLSTAGFVTLLLALGLAAVWMLRRY